MTVSVSMATLKSTNQIAISSLSMETVKLTNQNVTVFIPMTTNKLTNQTEGDCLCFYDDYEIDQSKCDFFSASMTTIKLTNQSSLTSCSLVDCPFLSCLLFSAFFGVFVDPFVGISIEEA